MTCPSGCVSCNGSQLRPAPGKNVIGEFPFISNSSCGSSYKVSVFVITYLAYMCYHMTRKPISVVKAVLQNCTSTPPVHQDGVSFSSNEPQEQSCGYPPFGEYIQEVFLCQSNPCSLYPSPSDGGNSEELFALLDMSFLLAYAIAMFISGFIAERVSLRYFLSFGMLLSGIFCYLFGIAKTANIHSMWFFVFVQIMAGVFQTTGWPGVVAVGGRWFGKSKRGLIFGIWNSHTSIGNVLGTVLPASYILTDWSMAFIVPGMIMGVMGFLVFLFLVDSPDIVGCAVTERQETSARVTTDYQQIGHQEDSDGSYTDDTNIVIGQQVSWRRG